MGFLAMLGVADSMSDTKKRLSVTDPVDPEVVSQLEDLSQAKMEIAQAMLELEQEKVGLLAHAHRVDQQTKRLFDGVLLERGIDPATRVTVSKSGEITLVKAE